QRREAQDRRTDPERGRRRKADPRRRRSLQAGIGKGRASGLRGSGAGADILRPPLSVTSRHEGTRHNASVLTSGAKPLEGPLELVTHKKFKGGRLMPWGKGTVVTGAKGFVFLSGNTATADDYDPFKKGGGAVGDAAAQWRNILTNIKSDLEELGTS